MFTRIHKPLTAAALSLALILGAMGASTGQARANNAEDAAAIIGGLIALYALGRALDGNNDRRGHIVQQFHNPRPHANTTHQPRRLVAPERCRREYQTRNGTFRGYGRRCMQNNVRRSDLLPSNCLRQVRTDRGTRNYYAGRCLARNGWVREGGRRNH